MASIHLQDMRFNNIYDKKRLMPNTFKDASWWIRSIGRMKHRHEFRFVGEYNSWCVEVKPTLNEIDKWQAFICKI